MPYLVRHRRIGLLLLLLFALSTAHAAPPSRLLPQARFDEWVRLGFEQTETRISQIWRQPLSNLPKGVDGYQMVSYQAEEMDSAAQAAERMGPLLQKKRFSNFIGQGYTVEVTPWAQRETQGAAFLVRGINHRADPVVANRAEIWTLAFVHETWAVWFEVRQSVTAPDMDLADKAFRHSTAHALAHEFAVLVSEMWRDTPPPIAPPVVMPPVEPPIVAPPVAPPVVTPPVEPPVEPPVVIPPVVTPPVEPPVDPNVPRWGTGDERFSLVLPNGWRAAGDQYPYVIQGPREIALKLYPPETYAEARLVSTELEAYATLHREISLGEFTQRPISINGLTGIRVQYTNYAKRTLIGYLFSKDGTFWRLEAELSTADTTSPAALDALIDSLVIK